LVHCTKNNLATLVKAFQSWQAIIFATNKLQLQKLQFIASSAVDVGL
jgi:hypothetical protein